MDRAGVTSGAAFRTALRGTLMLLAILTVVCAAAVFYVQSSMMAALEDQIAEDQIVLAQIYKEGGDAALSQVLDNLSHPLRTKLRAVGLFDAMGRKIGGNIDLAPDIVGWSRKYMTLSGSGADPAEHGQFHLFRGTLDHFTLVVGRNLSEVVLQRERMIEAFAALGVVTGLAFLILGYRASVQTLRKLDHMADTLDLVSQGDGQVRLALSAQNDQIDRVSRAMNLHLDRLSVLVATTKASAAAIAHDLRTPLSRAFLSLDRVQAALDAGDDPRNHIDGIEAELTRLRNIFDAILRISRLEQDRGRDGFVPVPLAPLLDDLAETFAPVAEERGQSLRVFTVPANLTLQGDAAMLSQLLANLIQNAITHCPAGTAISLGASVEPEGVRLWVADTGPGIPKAEQDRVFELFYRVDPNHRSTGNGLGMALVRAIADRLGARISLSDGHPGLRVDIVFAAPTVP